MKNTIFLLMLVMPASAVCWGEDASGSALHGSVTSKIDIEREFSEEHPVENVYLTKITATYMSGNIQKGTWGGFSIWYDIKQEFPFIYENGKSTVKQTNTHVTLAPLWKGSFSKGKYGVQATLGAQSMLIFVTKLNSFLSLPLGPGWFDIGLTLGRETKAPEGMNDIESASLSAGYGSDFSSGKMSWALNVRGYLERTQDESAAGYFDSIKVKQTYSIDGKIGYTAPNGFGITLLSDLIGVEITGDGQWNPVWRSIFSKVSLAFKMDFEIFRIFNENSLKMIWGRDWNDPDSRWAGQYFHFILGVDIPY